MKEAIIYNITKEGESMTREQAIEVKDHIKGQGGKIDRDGYITGMNIWTTSIEYIQKRSRELFFSEQENNLGKMRIGDWPANIDRREDRIVKFVDFNGEDMEIRVKDEEGEHDHIELWKNGERLAMMHVDKSMISVWIDKMGNKKIWLI